MLSKSDHCEHGSKYVLVKLRTEVCQYNGEQNPLHPRLSPQNHERSPGQQSV
jgi:hypothetical protein